MIDLLKILNQKIDKLDLQILDVKFERDHAATPMESASDKTRQMAEQLMDALGDERKKIILLKRRIKSYRQNPVYSISTPLGERDFILVPEGLGGKTIEGVTLLSDSSPMGLKLVDKQVGDSFEYNNQPFKILSSREP
jgi:hypothetical protein